MPLQPFSTGPSCRIAHQGPLVLMCLTQATTVDDLNNLEACQALVVKQYAKFVSLTVMNAGFLPANKAAIDRAGEVSHRFRDFNGGSVVVINARGLSAVVARTALAAFSMISSVSGELRTFSSVSEGVAHANGLMTTLGSPMTQPEVDALQQFILAAT